MELTKQQITEGNEKLAKILGWFRSDYTNSYVYYERGEIAIYVAYDMTSSPYRDLPFHRDWNYLMKIVDKIGSIIYHRDGDDPKWNWKNHYSYSELFQNIFTKWLHFRFEEHKEEFNLMNDLESIWCGCVAYVDWINKENAEAAELLQEFKPNIGKKVCKCCITERQKNNKKFKSGLTENTVKDVVLHEFHGLPAYSFIEDDSIVECRRCKVIDEPVILSPTQTETLIRLSEENSWKVSTTKARIKVMNQLQIKGMVRLNRYANGEFWEITDEGIDLVNELGR
jgi:hypothetical protein